MTEMVDEVVEKFRKFVEIENAKICGVYVVSLRVGYDRSHDRRINL